MYSPVSHGQVVRASLTELAAQLDEAEYELARLQRLSALSDDLTHARQAVAFARMLVQLALPDEAVVPSR